MIGRILLLQMLFIKIAFAQTCPVKIETDRIIKAAPVGWIGDAKSEKLNLIGFTVVMGSVQGEIVDPPIELVPEQTGNDYFWKFRDKVGKNEIWMTCVYENSSVLRVRIDSDSTECFLKQGGQVRRQSKSNVAINAGCYGPERKRNSLVK